MKKCLLVVLALFLLVGSVTFAEDKATDTELSSVRTKLKKAFPGMVVNNIVKADLPGLYEAEAGDSIFYYYPEKDLLFLGEIYTTDGKSLTAEKRLKKLPLDKAIKTGSGKNTIIEFTDVDCEFCRKAYTWLKDKNDITKYTFLTPIDKLHPKATEKSQYILSQKNPETRAEAYREAMEGKLDNTPLDGITEEARKMVNLHLDLGKKTGQTGTPLFLVNGKMISGADFPAIEKNLQK